jgi:CheY-like chemotaxis protein
MAHILLVDDNVDSSRALARVLQHFHHTVDAVDSGEAAVGYLQASVPDAMILDLMMPGMDGAEVLRRVRQDPRTADLPVVIYSAVADGAMRDHLLAKGAQDYWLKASFNLRDIEQRLDAVLCA